MFSSVDSKVAEHIFSFGLRSLLSEKTIILASNNDLYDKYADFIVYVDDKNELRLE